MTDEELKVLNEIEEILNNLYKSIPVIVRTSFREGVKLARDQELSGLDCMALFEMSESREELGKHE